MQQSIHRAGHASTPALAILKTKLYLPHPRADVVQRDRLYARLNEAVRGAVTLVSAPVGWGKTTLLSSWCAQIATPTRRVAWVSLDTGDNDPTRFWTYVLTALDTAQPGIGGEVALSLLHMPQSPPIMVLLTPILNALAECTTDTVLVLDDYHMIAAQSIHSDMISFVEHLSPNLHLLVATRIDPPWPLALLRARGRLAELRADELRFSTDETMAYLTDVMGLPVSAEASTGLQSRSEGWIAGLHLAALAAQGRSPEQIDAFARAVSGSHRYIVDYLIEEVLARQPAEIQDFLLRTAVPDRFCAPLCAVLLANGGDEDEVPPGSTTEHAGHAASPTAIANAAHNVQEMLEQVERSNLFVIPLDDERQWYRYHHLFADVLRNRLRHLHPELEPHLHRWASQWFEQHGDVSAAVHHALAVPDIERAADLVERYGHLMSLGGQLGTVWSWLQALPETMIRARPLLCLCQVTTLFTGGHIAEAVAWWREAEASIEARRLAGASEEELRPMRGTLATSGAVLVLVPGDLHRSVSLAQEALDLLPTSDVAIRVTAAGVLNISYLVTGDVRSTVVQAMSEHIARAVAAGIPFTALGSQLDLADIERMRGALRLSATLYEVATGMVPGSLHLHDLVFGPDHAFRASEVRLEQNALEEAERLITLGMSLIEHWVILAPAVSRGYCALARLQQARRQGAAALATLAAFAELAERRHFAPDARVRALALRAQISLAQGDLAAAVRWAETCGLSESDAEMSYLHEPEYFTLVRIRIAQARNTRSSAQLGEALRLLERIEQDAMAKERQTSVLEARILRALAYQAGGRETYALGELTRALAMAEPEGFIRLFADEGAPLAALLARLLERDREEWLAAQQVSAGYIQSVLAACGYRAQKSEPSAAATEPLVVPLSKRELDVLRLLAEGASNADIAESLVLSVGTVKKHVFNICSKLAVQNRTQAIARARTLHLL